MGNRSTVSKLLANFAAQYARTADDIREALDAGDFDRAHSLVHAIKGVAGNLSAREVQAAAVRLEKIVKHINPAAPPPADAMGAAYQSLARGAAPSADRSGYAGVQRFRGAYGPLRATPRRFAARSGPRSDRRLRTAAELGDVSELHAVAKELSARTSAFGAHAERIQRLADDFDFDGILKLAGELNSTLF